jgi:hypothetical protein
VVPRGTSRVAPSGSVIWMVPMFVVRLGANFFATPEFVAIRTEAACLFSMA